MNTELSLTIIAIALVFLVVFAIVTTVFLIQLLITLKKTTQAVEQKVSPILDDAKKVASFASDASQTVKNNLQSTTPLFNSIGKISGVMDGFSSRFKNDRNDREENTINVNFRARKSDIDFGDWAEWLGMGIVLIQKLRHRHRDDL